jgi:hypothetical protein
VRPNPLVLRSLVIAFLVVGLVDLPAMAAAEKPLGVVVLADHASLANAKATAGADVYSGDPISTDESGVLRMRVGPGQIYLLALSAAMLEPPEDQIHARLDKGTMGFSTPSPSLLQVETPIGLVRGVDPKPLFGQVTIINPTRLRVSVYQGAITVSRHGETKTISEGETYDVVLNTDLQQNNPPTPPPSGAGTGGGGGFSLSSAAAPIAAGAAAGALVCVLWPESDSNFGCWN